MEDFGLFYGHLVYFTYIWYTYFTAILFILLPLGIFYGNLVYFSVLVCCTEENLATLLTAARLDRDAWGSDFGVGSTPEINDETVA
jgi:hypothetical protein